MLRIWNEETSTDIRGILDVSLVIAMTSLVYVETKTIIMIILITIIGN